MIWTFLLFEGWEWEKDIRELSGEDERRKELNRWPVAEWQQKKWHPWAFKKRQNEEGSSEVGATSDKCSSKNLYLKIWFSSFLFELRAFTQKAALVSRHINKTLYCIGFDLGLQGQYYSHFIKVS